MMRGKKLLGIALLAMMWPSIKPITLPDNVARGIALTIAAVATVGAYKCTWDTDHYLIRKVLWDTPTTLAIGAAAFFVADGYLANSTNEGRLAIATMETKALMEKLNENQLFYGEFTGPEDLTLFIETFMGDKRLPLAEINQQLKATLTKIKHIQAIIAKLTHDSVATELSDQATMLSAQIETIEQKITTIAMHLEKIPHFKKQCEAYNKLKCCAQRAR
ncbi:MAG: hypothetical protein WCT20_04300 [Candidatus Babeliales bacterium]|jgi:hypothetical protein